MISYPTHGFITATPESQGVPSAALADILADIQNNDKDIHSFLLYRHGRLIYEHYFAPYAADTAHSMYSCSKTFTSMLIGIAQGKGLLKLTDPVLPFFPDVKVDNPSDNLRAMTIRDLLMMGSGHGEDTFHHMMDAEDGDWPRVFLNQSVDRKPGTYFVYNTGATYMLSAILTRVTGRTALQLANEWIFSEIGIEGATWDSCPKGVSIGGSGLHITPRDMLRMGILLLSGGRWGDRQIIPREYVQEAQHKKIENYDRNNPWQHPSWAAGYCYQLWRCAFPAFRADGMGGQYIVMFPGLDMVAVFTSSLGGDIAYPLDAMERFLLPHVCDMPLPVHPEESARLAAFDREPAPAAQPDSIQSFPFGVTYVLPESSLQLKTITVHKDALELNLEDGSMLNARFTWNAPLLNDDVVRRVPHRWMDRAPVAIMARAGEEALYLRLNYVGEPLTFHFYLAPAADGRLHARILSTMTGSLDALCAPLA